MFLPCGELSGVDFAFDKSTPAGGTALFVSTRPRGEPSLPFSLKFHDTATIHVFKLISGHVAPQSRAKLPSSLCCATSMVMLHIWVFRCSAPASPHSRVKRIDSQLLNKRHSIIISQTNLNIACMAVSDLVKIYPQHTGSKLPSAHVCCCTPSVSGELGCALPLASDFTLGGSLAAWANSGANELEIFQYIYIYGIYIYMGI